MWILVIPVIVLLAPGVVVHVWARWASRRVQRGSTALSWAVPLLMGAALLAAILSTSASVMKQPDLDKAGRIADGLATFANCAAFYVIVAEVTAFLALSAVTLHIKMRSIRMIPRKAVFFSVVATITILAGTWLTTFVSYRQTEPRILALVAEVASDEALRPVHRAPIREGSLASNLQPHLKLLREQRQRVMDLPAKEQEKVAVATRGEAPVGVLPPPWPEVLKLLRPSLPEILASSQARSGRGLTGLNTESADIFESDGNLILQFLVRTAALDIWNSIQLGNTERAALTCLDALAIARDTSHNFLVGQMVAVAMVKLVRPSCIASIERAPPKLKTELLRELDTLREGFAPVSKTMRQEAVFTQLAATGKLLSSSTRLQLAKGPQHLVGAYGPREHLSTLLQYVFGYWFSVRTFYTMLDVARNVDSSPQLAEASVRQLDNPPVIARWIWGTGGQWKSILERLAEGRTVLSDLSVAASQDSGEP